MQQLRVVRMTVSTRSSVSGAKLKPVSIRSTDYGCIHLRSEEFEFLSTLKPSITGSMKSATACVIRPKPYGNLLTNADGLKEDVCRHDAASADGNAGGHG